MISLSRAAAENQRLPETMLKNHCQIGYRIAKSLLENAPIARDILSHHEYWNGSGYPLVLKGDDIPLNALILSVLDTYDNMVYGENPVSLTKALAFIQQYAGIYFSPQVVAAFLAAMSKESKS